MRSLFIVLLLIASNCFSQQVSKVLTGSNGAQIPFLEFKPADYGGAIPNPCIIYFHGIGDCGFNTNMLLFGPIPKLLTGGTQFRFTGGGVTRSYVVLSPQAPAGCNFWPISYIRDILNYAKTLKIDLKRIYATGFSLGGGAIWSIANDSTLLKQFAAIAPLAGTCTLTATGAANIKKYSTAVWAFHGIDDPTVPVSCTTTAINDINMLNPIVKPVYTLYNAGMGHNINTYTYDTLTQPSLYSWFLNYTLTSSEVPPIPVPPSGPVADFTWTTRNDSLFLDARTSTGAGTTYDAYDWYFQPAQGGTWNYIVEGGRYGSTKLIRLLTAGTYSARLTVKAANGTTAQSTQTISIGNVPPPVLRTVVLTITITGGKTYTLYSDNTWQ